jgi:hypothetical protein
MKFNSTLLFLIGLVIITSCGQRKKTSDLKAEEKTENKELSSSPQELQQTVNNTAVEDSLAGVWLRSDGTYRIEITEVKEDGTLIAKYFNPDPINVGKSGWRIQNDELQLFVELSDENYPGSFYELTYDAVSGMLSGTYYQAVSKETYEVSFKK